MDEILAGTSRKVKDRVARKLRDCRDARLCRRYLIVMNLLNGRAVRQAGPIGTLFRIPWRGAILWDHSSFNGDRSMKNTPMVRLRPTYSVAQ
jgi:hypothetical protein